MSQSPVLTYRRNAAPSTPARSRGKALEIPPNQSSSAAVGARRQARGGAFAWGWLTALLPRSTPATTAGARSGHGVSGNKIPRTGQ